MDKLPYSTLSQAWAYIEPTVRAIPRLPDTSLQLQVYRDIWYAGTLAAAKLLSVAMNEEDDEKGSRLLKSLADELEKHDIEVATRARSSIEDFFSSVLGEKGK